MKRSIWLLLAVVLVVSACERKEWEYPGEPAYWIGKWDIDAVFDIHPVSKEQQFYNNAKGFVRFKKRLKADMYGKGSFEITYSAPNNATLLSETEVTYKGDFTWRTQGIGLVIVMDEEDEITPGLGVGRASLADFNIYDQRFKYDYVEIYTNASEPGISGRLQGLQLSR